MRPKDRPIGVFDSGIGGLTVLAALARRMPEENLVYFGDTAHLPYGDKSPETVTRYSLSVARFLEGLGVKALVIACNTASALALPEVRRRLNIPVLGVIEPGADAACAATRNGRIGIIGTAATIASGAYSAALKARRPGARLTARACPLFVPLVEEGWWRHDVTEAVARHYLKPLSRAGVDSLVLGCTHYPLLKPVLRRVMGKGVKLIDSAEEVSRQAAEVLETAGLLRLKGGGARRFFVSDGPERFRKLAGRFLPGGRPKVEVRKFE